MKLQEDRVCEFLDACWGAGIKNPESLRDLLHQLGHKVTGVSPLPDDPREINESRITIHPIDRSATIAGMIC